MEKLGIRLEGSDIGTRNNRFRDRILRLDRIRCGDLIPHPGNPRLHPAAQLAATTGLLVDVGKCRPLIAFPADGWGPDGDFSQLMVSDGHGRRVIDPDEVWPVAVTDLTRTEADEMLFGDATGEMAEYDPVKLDAMLREVNTGCAELQQMFDDLWSNVQGDAIAGTEAIASTEPAGDGKSVGDVAYRVVVSVADATAQEELIARLESEGYECQPLMS